MSKDEQEQVKQLVRAVRKDVWLTCLGACACALALDHIASSIGKAIGAFLWGHFHAG